MYEYNDCWLANYSQLQGIYIEVVHYLFQHDANMAAMMGALGVWDGTQPPYSAAFLAELYSDQNK